MIVSLPTLQSKSSMTDFLFNLTQDKINLLKVVVINTSSGISKSDVDYLETLFNDILMNANRAKVHELELVKKKLARSCPEVPFNF
ncbi:MAG: hypothetical protein VW397_06415 [Candidatus Margulisiibacteriota bacterium]